jgi:hypothetical protein
MPDTAPEYEYKNPFNEEAEGIEIKHLGDLAGEMVYRLPGCSALMIRKELQQSWYEFASRTGILRFPMKVALVDGKRKYGLTAPCPAAISRVSEFMLAMEDADGVHPHRYEWVWHRIGYANNGEHATVILDFNIDADFLKIFAHRPLALYNNGKHHLEKVIGLFARLGDLLGKELQLIF